MSGYRQTQLVTSEIVRLVTIGLFSAVETGLAEARKYAVHKFEVTGKLLVMRSIASVLALLSVIWFGVGATIALAQFMPLWGALFTLSGVLALGSCIAFIAKPEPAVFRRKDETTATEKENENAS